MTKRAPRFRVVMPQYERGPGDTAPGAPPASREDWDDLRTMNSVALREMGMGLWSEERDADGKVLVLFPGEWYRHIPAGFVVESISYSKHAFKSGVTDNDIRFGFLAYGIRSAP